MYGAKYHILRWYLTTTLQRALGCHMRTAAGSDPDTFLLQWPNYRADYHPVGPTTVRITRHLPIPGCTVIRV